MSRVGALVTCPLMVCIATIRGIACITSNNTGICVCLASGDITSSCMDWVTGAMLLGGTIVIWASFVYILRVYLRIDLTDIP